MKIVVRQEKKRIIFNFKLDYEKIVKHQTLLTTPLYLTFPYQNHGIRHFQGIVIDNCSLEQKQYMLSYRVTSEEQNLPMLLL